MSMTRHFTVSVYVVHGEKVLLHHHKKLGTWLPVGGHIDEDELPDVAAVRETREESGLDVTLIDQGKRVTWPRARTLTQPMHVLLEDITPTHQHIDFIYFATSESAALQPHPGETQDVRWFAETELVEEQMLESVRELGKEAITLLRRTSKDQHGRNRNREESGGSGAAEAHGERAGENGAGPQ